jgi:hypothetical protein
LAISEEILDLFRFKLDYHDDIADPSLDQCPDCSLEEWFSTDREQMLRTLLGKRPEPFSPPRG